MTGSEYRTLVCYKETWANGDPNAAAADYANIDPANDWTGTWRDMRFVDAVDAEGNHTAGGSRLVVSLSGNTPNCSCITGAGPETTLTGQLFGPDGNGQKAAMDVPAVIASLRYWAHTTIAESGEGREQFANGILGYEWDVAVDDQYRPAGLIKLSETLDIPWNNILIDQGNTTVAGTADHNITLYRAESGALVFSAGTVFWSWGLSNEHDSSPYGGNIEDTDLKQFTVNLLADMGIQPGVDNSVLETQGLVRATMTTDTAPATASIDALGEVHALQSKTITGTATDVGGHVALVEVSLDGGTTWRPAQSTSGWADWSYTWRPTTEGAHTIQARAIDDSLNVFNAISTEQNVTVLDAILPDSVSLFDGAAVTGSSYEGTTVELGMKFFVRPGRHDHRAALLPGGDGRGRHRRSHWSLWRVDDGALLATATFTSGVGESGWQVATLDHPLQVLEGIEYVVSYVSADNYFAANGFFHPNNEVAFDGVDDNAFTDPFGVLSSPENSQLGDGEQQNGNGVYRPNVQSDASPVMPRTTYQSSNYWVDVTFVPGGEAENTPPTITSNGGAAAVSINVPENSTLVTTFSASDVETPVAGLAFTLTGEDAGLFHIVGNQIHFFNAPDFEDRPSEGVTPGYQVTLNVSDGHGGTDTQDITVTVTDVNEGAATGSSLFGQNSHLDDDDV